MKKRILFVLCTVLVSMTLCMTFSATEIQDTPEGTTQGTTQGTMEGTVEVDITVEPTVEPTVEAEDEATYHTLFTRLWEYVNEHKTEVVGVLGDVAIFVLALFIKLRNDKKTTSIAQNVISIKGDTSTTNSSQNSVVDVVNDMVDGYNALKESYDKYGGTEDDRNRVVGALVAQNTAILEILTTVYANSKNLPQGVKDLVNLKYANCLKSLDDDERLKAIITAVRENIGTNKIVEENTEENTEAEV